MTHLEPPGPAAADISVLVIRVEAMVADASGLLVHVA